MKKLFTFLTFLAFVSNVTFAQIFSEDFEAGSLPTDWTIESDATDGGFVFENASGASSSSYAFPAHTIFASTNDDACNCDKMLERLTSPEIDLAATEGVLVLSYDWSFANGDYQGANETAKVYILSDGTETLLADLDGEGSFSWYTAGHDITSYINETIQIIFEYSDGGGWNYAFGIDDVEIENLTGVEASMVSVDNYKYAESGDYSVDFTVSNTAAEEITSFDITWEVNGDSYNESFTSSITYGQVESFSTVGEFTVGIDMISDITVTLTSVNGESDYIGSVDMAVGSVNGVEYFTERTVFIEEATGTWCGWCPRGAVYMDIMAEDYPNTTFLSAVHNSDPMEVPVYDNGIGPLIGGYPSGLVDRTFNDVDPSSFPANYELAIEVPSIVEMNGSTASYDYNTGMMTIDIDCKFTTSVSGDYRLNVVVVEDGVTGTSNGYNQVNYYSGGNAGPMGGYENLSDPVPAVDMVYDHVARAILGGFNGTAGSLPADIDYNVVNEYTYTWEVDEDYDVSNMHVGILVINNETGQIENAYAVEGGVTGIEEKVSSISNFNIYPNPTNDIARIAFNLEDNKNVRLEVIDVLGKIVYVENYGQMNAGQKLIEVDASHLGNGLYIFNIHVDGEVISERVSIRK